MKILFLSIGDIPSIRHREIYPDLLREFIKRGDEVYVICCRERREGLSTEMIREDGATLLKVKVGNIKKVNMIEKGISTVLIPFQYKRAIRKYFPDIRFDCIMYSTPPITLYGIVKHLKKKNRAKTYLLLKDIFPQNAVDLGLLKTSGIKGILYRYFRAKEKALYRVSDTIGCMSPANVQYVISHNPFVDPAKVEVCPNSMEVRDVTVREEERKKIREKYHIPPGKKVFLYGGNLGKPQDVPFIVNCLKAVKDIEDAFFLMIGDGTEYGTLEQYVSAEKPANVKVWKWMPKEDYEAMVGAADVGLIFLDYRFTVPNFPSRLLPYMQARLPVIACTDTVTDIRTVLEEGKFGWWCPSNDAEGFRKTVEQCLHTDTSVQGENAYAYLLEHYTAELSCDMIKRSISQ